MVQILQPIPQPIYSVGASTMLLYFLGRGRVKTIGARQHGGDLRSLVESGNGLGWWREISWVGCERFIGLAEGLEFVVLECTRHSDDIFILELRVLVVLRYYKRWGWR